LLLLLLLLTRLTVDSVNEIGRPIFQYLTYA